MKRIFALSLLLILVLTTASCSKSQASAQVLSPDSVEAMLRNSGEYQLTVVELGSVRCRPCQMMTPVLESVAKSYQGKVRVVFFDVWENQTPAQHYQIRVIPVQVILDSEGKEVFRNEGFYPEQELRNKIDSLLQ